MKSILSDKRNIWRIAGMLPGIAAIIIGISFLGAYGRIYRGDMSNVTFGADFYTEMHKATIAAVNALRKIYQIIGAAAGWFFILSGVIDIVIFGQKLTTSITKSANISVQADIQEQSDKQITE